MFQLILFQIIILNSKKYLYIMDINLLSDILFSNVVSHSVGCLVAFLRVFFKKIFIYLAAPGLNCSMQDLRSLFGMQDF